MGEHDSCFKTDGQHGIQIQGLDGRDGSPISMSTWTDGGLVALTQSGDQPRQDPGTDWAVGPTGVVATYLGRIWIGLPSSD